MEEFNGLTKKEVEKIREENGSNSIPKPRYVLLKLILNNLKGTFNILLLFAAIITFMLGSTTDGIFILIFIFIGVTLSVFQEYKSNVAVQKLKTYLLRTITVRRDGIDQEVSTEDLVVGDIMKLESGDIVPADSVIRFLYNLKVDETTFTGESIPVTKKALSSKLNDAIEENRLYQGVVIVSGNAIVEVTATGVNTKLAKIASKASEVQNESRLTKGVNQISKFILKTTLITLTLIILINIVIKGKDADIPELLVFSIALAVSVIPEALQLVNTFSLSRGALQFAKNDVLVKRLSSVQDLGMVDLLCTDKTGTLTENHLTYVNSYKSSSSHYDPLLLIRLAAIGLKEKIPEPFDKASDEAITKEQRLIVDSYKIVMEEAFDPSLRSNGAIVENKDGKKIHIRRGSPEYFIDEGLIKYDEVKEWLTSEEKKGHRVLGVSYDEGECLVFGGFISFVDSLKPTTVETLKQAKELNIAITIITGDSLLVAKAIGKEAGLVTKDDEVIEAKDFLSLPSLEQRSRVSSIRVFARTTPEQKLTIIELLKEKHTVGYLGEGINDAPALKSAHVSMVVESASDVARELSDIVLLKKDLRVIIMGIRLGRKIHANIMKYIKATLVSNFGNFYAVAIGSLFITFLPMLPKQLLLLNLLSDFPMMAIAFDKVSKEEIAKPQRYDFRSLYIIFITLGLVSTVFDFTYFALFYRISPEVLQTNWFIASVITEILLVFSIRSMGPMIKSGLPAPIIIYLSSIALVLTIVLPMIPVSANFFEFAIPSLNHLAIIIALAFTYLVITELVKRPLNKFLFENSKTEYKKS